MFLWVCLLYTLVLRLITTEPDLQMRYYTIILLIFDVVQVHSFALPGVPTKERYVGSLSLTIFGVISLIVGASHLTRLYD
jgi:hypothetical protein